MQTRQRYQKPPITEAVIEIRFERDLGRREMERARDRFKRWFPAIEETFEVNVKIQAAGGSVQTSPERVGFKLTSKDGLDLVLIRKKSIATIRRAPYEGWEEFIVNVKENFENFEKVVKRRDFARLGVRFINRLDIPDELIQGQPLDRFLKVRIDVPEEMANSVGNFGLSIELIEPKVGAKVRVLSRIVEPALLDHVSIQYDIDAFFDREIPPRTEAVWELLDKLRDAKNAVFEAGITDEARKLFQ